MLVSISLDTGAEPNFAVPASPLIEPESLTSAVPSARQNVSASSVSTRLHCGQRFILLLAHLLRKADFLQQLLKPRVVAQRIEQWIDFEE